jgi:hypothetical protein
MGTPWYVCVTSRLGWCIRVTTRLDCRVRVAVRRARLVCDIHWTSAGVVASRIVYDVLRCVLTALYTVLTLCVGDRPDRSTTGGLGLQQNSRTGPDKILCGFYPRLSVVSKGPQRNLKPTFCVNTAVTTLRDGQQSPRSQT